jgi:hypothetical protein
MKPIVIASLLAASAAFPAAAALGGPYDQAYSIIDTETMPSADPKLIPVIVNRVDDQNPTSRNNAVVPPGSHQVTVDVPPRKGFRTATQHTFALVTAPCMRYNVAAKLDNTLTQEWKPVVRSQERIGECEAKFAKAR